MLTNGLSKHDQFIKRSFDLCVSGIGLVLTGWIIVVAWILSGRNIKASGFFRQDRVGKDGRLFEVFKIRTMRNLPGMATNVTTDNDPRITRLGHFFRKTKIDELPQLINVFLGQMSFVGPRPDVPGFADKLTGDDRIILTVRPGITGPATLKFRDEEKLLGGQPDPERYNREVIYPEKVRLNREYVENYSFWKDIGYILKTIFGK
jgi:lipopolysaccharide/colanic/teichoic acid biosynthesis glycosyltransferase